jgi:Flp pilus assembly protein TadB
MNVFMIAMTGAAALFAAGVYVLLLYALKMPTFAEERAAKKIREMGAGQRADPVDRLVLLLAKPISKAVFLEPFSERRLAATLAAAGIDFTPRQYIGVSIASALPVLLLAIPAYFLMPAAIVLVVIATMLQVVHYYDRAAKAAKKRRDQVEDELPRFVRQIAEQLKRSRDIYTIFESYRRTAGPLLGGQIDIVLADMKSGGMERALERFDVRVGSPLLSNVARGLLGVLRGDTGLVYFEQLARDFKQIEISRLKKEAQKRPARIRRYSLLMLCCFLALFFVVFAIQIIAKLSVMFS